MADFIKLPLQNVKALENKNNTSKAIELALKATEEDRKKNYHEAIKLYKNCNEILRQILRGKNLSKANTVVLLNKHEEYAERVKKIRYKLTFHDYHWKLPTYICNTTLNPSL